MSERKVLNKYYPPDFDPNKIVRLQKGSDRKGPKQQTVRLMTPYSMKCNACGEYIYKGRKFNARKENSGESYYSIPIFRFYIRCTRCSSEITFKTDPKVGIVHDLAKKELIGFFLYRMQIMQQNTAHPGTLSPGRRRKRRRMKRIV